MMQSWRSAMAVESIRIENITIENFKNVENGSLDLENHRKNYSASIVGIYGQNGSGKTALIDALRLLKYALCGAVIPGKYADYINIEKEYATLSFQWKAKRDETAYDIWYEFSLRKNPDELHTDDEPENQRTEDRVQIFNETLSFGYASDQEKSRKGVLIDTETSEVFVPKSKYRELLGEDGKDITELLVTKRLAQEQSRSFIFCKSMMDRYRKNCRMTRYMDVIESLHTFGRSGLFIIDTGNSGLISMNALPLTFKYRDNHKVTVGNLMLPLNGATPILEDRIEIVRKIIVNMNIVLEQLVPGLTVDIVDLGSSMSKEGKAERLVQMVSLKNGKAIPFCYESEGIKKIVSILQLLIVVYNNASITVAIDELDSGIFEYLLGEILRIISEKGKGQLIFTSHNLRPLETLDKGFVAFTTTNPKNRYIRMTNVKENNNLRDFYYRDIVLGEQNEQLYNPTNNFEIALAFREAGEAFDS